MSKKDRRAARREMREQRQGKRLVAYVAAALLVMFALIFAATALA